MHAEPWKLKCALLPRACGLGVELGVAALAAAARQVGRRCWPAAPSVRLPHCPWRVHCMLPTHKPTHAGAILL